MNELIINIIAYGIAIIILLAPIWIPILIICIIKENRKKYEIINKTKEKIWDERNQKYNPEQIFNDRLRNEREYKTQKQKTKIIRLNNNVNKDNNYKESIYYKETNIDYNEMITDKGRAGEYATSLILQKIQGNRKYLFNIYVPRENNKTSEIDIVMIHENGIFVVENKNFKGWIIGDETHDQWCEITWRGKNQKKYFFYNPIRQNCNHIKSLKKIIGEKEINSIIVFNNEAQLKKITNSNPDISVINAKSIIPTIVKKLNKSEITYTKEEIDNIYNELKKYSEKNISDEIKEKHI